MPGFYKQLENGMHWVTFERLRAASIEMNFAEADILFDETIPNLKRQLKAEGVDDMEIKISTCRPVSGPCYGQVSAEGINYQSKDEASK